MSLHDPVTTIPFVGEKYRKLLKKLEIETVEDLLRHYPTRYDDLSTTKQISKLVAGEKATICAEVLEIKNIRTRYGKLLTRAIVNDESGTLLIVWFNQPYLTNAIRAGSTYNFSGELKSFSGQPAFLGPEYERIAKRLDSEAARQQSSEAVRQRNKKIQRTSNVILSGAKNLHHCERDPSVRCYVGPQNDQKKAVPLSRCPAVQLIHTGRLVPIYPETAGVSSKWLRSRINHVIHTLVYDTTTAKADPLPEITRKKHNLINLNEALRKIHFPQNRGEVTKARKRLAFEEVFLLQLKALKKRQDWKKQQPAFSIRGSANSKQQTAGGYQPSAGSSRQSAAGNREKATGFIESLPFELTRAQRRCIDEILSDLEKTTPANRLLQGDVGCGKTIVAATAAYTTALAGYQTAYMAPTEILAQQVYEVFKKYLEPLEIEVMLQTGSKPSTADCQPSTAKIIVGTHALLHRPELFKNLALVIIDEQHRFGVKQRGKLLKSQQGKESDSFSKTPHLLTMTATPIPRSLVLTTYGHLDISIIDEMPKGVKPTKTWLVPEEKRAAGYEWIKEQLSATSYQQATTSKTTPHHSEEALATEESLNRREILRSAQDDKSRANQAFVICPLIKESEHETFEDVKAVTTEFERLKDIFPEFKLGLLHGRMKRPEKEKILNNFRVGKTQILVSTPVVEVGIDIPQANIMIIESAHRFGLASLHQLRGRVGRAGQESYCLLFTPKQTERIRHRLKALEKHHSGLELAEIDLTIRGPGEIYGTKQHGVPNLKIASLSDLPLVRAARTAAEEVITKIENYPELEKKIETGEVAPN